MPHDCLGRKIEFGDWVKARPYNYPEYIRGVDFGTSYGRVVGRVVQMRSGQSCSGDMVWQSLDGLKRDAFGADEAEIVLKHDGSEPEVAKAKESK